MRRAEEGTGLEKVSWGAPTKEQDRRGFIPAPEGIILTTVLLITISWDSKSKSEALWTLGIQELSSSHFISEASKHPNNLHFTASQQTPLLSACVLHTCRQLYIREKENQYGPTQQKQQRTDTSTGPAFAVLE